MLDLHFPVLGSSLSVDHGYDLYGALARLVPQLHEAACKIRVGPIRGSYAGNGSLTLDSRFSRLRLRLAAEEIPLVLQLAGKAIDVGGHRLRLGVPQVRNLIPAPNLVARLVTIKGFTEPGPFLEAVGRQLAKLEIAGQPGIPQLTEGARAGQPRRHVLRVKDKRVVGFPVIVSGLSAEESVNLQENGLGGRSRMGCGFFLPVQPR
ncbi:MAG TPA: type I-MYXAN CRISPR-associated protein Cas6/Cmx6 [Gemmataceae bacterium]|nr:type I-MYXAN CRISPR-associated protein Cas6/Cmx6 [Gemmataceae bacterium]